MKRLSWRLWSRDGRKSRDETEPASGQGANHRQLLRALSAVAGSGAFAAMSQSAAAKDASELPPPSAR